MGRYPHGLLLDLALILKPVGEQPTSVAHNQQ